MRNKKKLLIILIIIFLNCKSGYIKGEEFEKYIYSDVVVTDKPLWNNSLSVKDSLLYAIDTLKESLQPHLLKRKKISEKLKKQLTISKFSHPVIIRNIYGSSKNINEKKLFSVFWPYEYDNIDLVGSIRTTMYWKEEDANYQFGSFMLDPINISKEDKLLILISEDEIYEMIEDKFHLELKNKPLAVNISVKNHTPGLDHWFYYVYVDEGIIIDEISIKGILIWPFALVSNKDYTISDLWESPNGYTRGYEYRAYYFKNDSQINLLDISEKELNGEQILYSKRYTEDAYSTPEAELLFKAEIIPFND